MLFIEVAGVFLLDPFWNVLFDHFIMMCLYISWPVSGDDGSDFRLEPPWETNRTTEKVDPAVIDGRVLNAFFSPLTPSSRQGQVVLWWALVSHSFVSGSFDDGPFRLGVFFSFFLSKPPCYVTLNPQGEHWLWGVCDACLFTWTSCLERNWSRWRKPLGFWTLYHGLHSICCSDI